jgi:hypothetical protein
MSSLSLHFIKFLLNQNQNIFHDDEVIHLISKIWPFFIKLKNTNWDYSGASQTFLADGASTKSKQYPGNIY